MEPLEPLPFGDINLAEARRRTHVRMLLSGGNVPWQFFASQKPTRTREAVKKAIDEVDAGGGFSLRTTGGHADFANELTADELHNVIANIEAYIEAGLQYGKY